MTLTENIQDGNAASADVQRIIMEKLSELKSKTARVCFLDDLAFSLNEITEKEVKK